MSKAADGERGRICTAAARRHARTILDELREERERAGQPEEELEEHRLAKAVAEQHARALGRAISMCGIACMLARGCARAWRNAGSNCRMHRRI